jgi:hypothetical protein
MDCDMHERRRGNGGPGLGLLLLIPAAVIIAKGVSRRRAMWHSGFGPGGGQPDPSTFRLPPRIEWMLETWHTRAHQGAEQAESTTV